ncbi:MAG TPA: GNAT family N-acetyltransferase [Jatrophihabitans sp.]|nr:GNAT family N-acetyltransferase [Jatrophihabitans sp.]
MTLIQARPRVLNAADSARVRVLVDADLIAHCALDARLRVVPDLAPRRFGGQFWGVDGPHRDLRAAAFHGGNLIPLGDDLAGLELIARQLARTGRGCSSIVGPADGVAAMWDVLSRRWGPARAVRWGQPLLCIRTPAPVEADPGVRLVHPTELDRFLPAAVAMFTEELDISPIAHDAGRGYRNRVADLIGAGRAFARFDDRGRVIFKAEIGALSPATAQIQGVWVRRELRGQGLGTAAMAAVVRLALRRAPSVSLYVNDYNEAGRAMYARLGFVQVGTLRTVLF